MTTWGEVPAGAGDAARATPAGCHGKEFRAAWKAAQAQRDAVVRRRAVRRKGGDWRAGMARRPPPEPDGDQAA